MPTINQLAPATAASDTDEFLVSQSGITRSITRALVLAGVQPQLSVASGMLVGGPNTGSGAPQQVSVGSNLTLALGTLTANASPYIVARLPSGVVPASTDSVPIGQAGTNVAVTYGQFLSGISGVAGVNGSQLLVTATGSTVQQRLADFAASTLPKTGGTLSGPLSLAADPSAALQAATKEYVDTRLFRSGDTLTGPLTLVGNPSGALQAAPKQYVDNQVATAVPLTGGTLTGPLSLAADPSAALQAATKEYVDTRLFRSGDTLTGPLTLVGNPSGVLQAAPKQYVDNQVATALPLTGGTLSGMVSLPGNPSGALQAAPKQYVDNQVATALPLSGGTLTGAVSLPGNPSGALQAAPKQYVDAQLATSLPLTGGSLSGFLALPGSPTSALQAAPKQYVDSQVATALPLAGGTLSGALTLASAPTTSLQAATKSYVDLRVQKAGDAMSGPLTMTQSYTGSAVPGLLMAARAQSAIGDASVVSSAMTLAFAGGAGSSNTNTLLTTTIGSVLGSNGNAVDGPGTEVYSLVSYLNSTALRPLGVSPVAAQHVSIQSAPTRNLPPGGVPAGRQMAELWALWLPTVDNTNLPSSIANTITGNEIDLIANNADDANGRFGIQLVLTEAKTLASGGYPLEWAYGITTTTTATSQFKWMANLQGNYSIAVIDTRNAFANGTAGAPPNIITALTSPSPTIHVSNVLPFTSAGVYGHPVSSSNTTPVRIGSDTYTQTGYSFDGAGLQSGTVTVSSPVSVADGAVGNLVTNTSRTIWLATGQQIAFDYGGAISVFFDAAIGALHVTSSITADGGLVIDHPSGTSLFWDSAALGTSGGAHLQGNLLVTGSIYTWSNLTVGGSTYLAGVVNLGGPVSVSGTSTFLGAVSMNGGLTVASGALVAKGGASFTGGLSVVGGPLGLPSYTVATLPAASAGTLAYATNGRKTGEAAGAGSGVLAVGNGSGQWISVMSGTAVAA
jgi:formylmethanofuran dehydrogenase subunit C